jgi:RNA polymerase sigma-70 factor, ECF subfamily
MLSTMTSASYPLGETTDETLAVSARSEREAFLELYDRYVPAIERYVAARTGSADVEDTVSAIFLKALTRLRTFRPERGAFRPWLFTIARTTVVDGYRSRHAAVQSTDLSWIADPSPGPESAVLGAEARTATRAALATLTQEQRDALALRYAADLPFVEIARTMQRSEPAAKMLVQRGLHTLRRYLEENPI